MPDFLHCLNIRAADLFCVQYNCTPNSHSRQFRRKRGRSARSTRSLRDSWRALRIGSNRKEGREGKNFAKNLQGGPTAAVTAAGRKNESKKKQEEALNRNCFSPSITKFESWMVNTAAESRRWPKRECVVGPPKGALQCTHFAETETLLPAATIPCSSCVVGWICSNHHLPSSFFAGTILGLVRTRSTVHALPLLLSLLPP